MFIAPLNLRCHGGGDESERSAIKAAQHPAKFSDAATGFTSEASLVAEATLLQLHISRTGLVFVSGYSVGRRLSQESRVNLAMAKGGWSATSVRDRRPTSKPRTSESTAGVLPAER
ncbi:hypothetical protein CRG98_047829 [Punica granatum]|nr:hypothetical protein CRG98_047829 [Punica granatum]